MHEFCGMLMYLNKSIRRRKKENRFILGFQEIERYSISRIFLRIKRDNVYKVVDIGTGT